MHDHILDGLPAFVPGRPDDVSTRPATRSDTPAAAATDSSLVAAAGLLPSTREPVQ